MTEQAYVARLHLLDQASSQDHSPKPQNLDVLTPPLLSLLTHLTELRVRTPQYDSRKPKSFNPIGWSWGRDQDLAHEHCSPFCPWSLTYSRVYNSQSFQASHSIPIRHPNANILTIITPSQFLKEPQS